MAKKLGHILTKEYLQSEFQNKGRTPKEIGLECGVHEATIYNWLRKHQIELKPQYDDLTDRVFGKWKVISFSRSENEHSIWNCRCVCGKECEVHRISLIQKTSRQCRSCADKGKAPSEEFRESFLNKIRLCAKRRKIDFDLTRDQLWDLFLDQDRKCALSGLSLKFSKTNRGNFTIDTTASLDRIDSSKSYTLDNVQWVHKDVNRMKQVFEEKYFKYLCCLIAENQSKEGHNNVRNSEVSDRWQNA